MLHRWLQVHKDRPSSLTTVRQADSSNSNAVERAAERALKRLENSATIREQQRCLRVDAMYQTHIMQITRQMDNNKKLLEQIGDFIHKTSFFLPKAQGVPEEKESNTSEDPKASVYHSIGVARLRLWLLFSEPDSSSLAWVVNIIVLSLITISSVTFCLETEPYFQNAEREPLPAFSIVELVCVIGFTLEYLIRLLCTPKRGQFLKSPLNAIDLLSILPFYIEAILKGSGAGLGGTRIVRIVRLVRVFRVLKLGGRFEKMQVHRNLAHAN